MAYDQKYIWYDVSCYQIKVASSQPGFTWNMAIVLMYVYVCGRCQRGGELQPWFVSWHNARRPSQTPTELSAYYRPSTQTRTDKSLQH